MKTVLIVDDSSVVRMSLSFFLRKNGYNVIEAVDGQDGLDKSSQDNIDLIVTDINMPNINGIELIKRIRGQEATQYIPILVLTSENSNNMLEKGKKGGATAWIVKPFTNDSLLKTINKILG